MGRVIGAERMKPLVKNRVYGIDVLKSIAIIGVLIIHVCIYTYPVTSSTFVINVFWGSISRASVPLFFLCSGAVFLSQDRPLSIKKLFTKNILHILVAMFVWAMAYKVFHLVEQDALSWPTLFHGLKEVLLFNQEFHLYFLQIILLVYLFLPITDIIVKHATVKQLRYLLLLWFLFGILYPTISRFWPFNLLSMMIPQFKLNIVYGAIGYGLLGYYMRQYPPSRKSGAIAAVSGFLFIFGGTIFLSIKAGALDAFFMEVSSVGSALMSAGLFSLCAPLVPRKDKLRRLVTYISKSSFCIFLCHVFFCCIFRNAGITAALFPPLLGVPIMMGMILLCSLAVYVLLSHIPLIRNWMI